MHPCLQIPLVRLFEFFASALIVVGSGQRREPPLTPFLLKENTGRKKITPYPAKVLVEEPAVLCNAFRCCHF